MKHSLTLLFGVLVLSAAGVNALFGADTDNSSNLAQSLGISFAGPGSTLILERDGKRYRVDMASKTVQEIGPAAATGSALNSDATAALFRQNCAECHGTGNGIAAKHTPDFTSPSFQHSVSDQDIAKAIRDGAASGRMPAWSGKLSDDQIASLATYVRSFSNRGVSGSGSPAPQTAESHGNVYQPGDDVLFTLPTGRAVDEHGLYVNFTHRFPYDAAFSGTGRGGELFGLDNFALASFGLRYGATDKLSFSVFRSPTFINRPIQFMAAYNILNENHEDPFNLAVRVSIEGQNNFRKNFTENIEGVFSRSVTSKAQIYVVPTASFNARPVVQALGFGSSDILDFPGVNTFSIGVGVAYDIRPTVALVAEVIPTVLNASELGIHRPAFSFGIQKKIYRHAFTLGLTTGPGVTVSQRAATRAQFLGQPSADTPDELFFGFDLTRQIH